MLDFKPLKNATARGWYPPIVAYYDAESVVMVIVNGVTVYQEENDDRDYTNRGFSALEVAKRLSKALRSPVKKVSILKSDLQRALGEAAIEWNMDDLREIALKKAGARK